jgi:hypothetical protein
VPETKRSAVTAIGCVIVLVLIVVSGLAFNSWSQERTLCTLPAEERAALVSRTADELHRFCGQGRPDALTRYCHELASFAASFHGCQEACGSLADCALAPAPIR